MANVTRRRLSRGHVELSVAGPPIQTIHLNSSSKSKSDYLLLPFRYLGTLIYNLWTVLILIPVSYFVNLVNFLKLRFLSKSVSSRVNSGQNNIKYQHRQVNYSQRPRKMERRERDDASIPVSGHELSDPTLARQKAHHRKGFEYISAALKIDEENGGIYLKI